MPIFCPNHILDPFGFSLESDFQACRGDTCLDSFKFFLFFFVCLFHQGKRKENNKKKSDLFP